MHLFRHVEFLMYVPTYVCSYIVVCIRLRSCNLLAQFLRLVVSPYDKKTSMTYVLAYLLIIIITFIMLKIMYTHTITTAALLKIFWLRMYTQLHYYYDYSQLHM